MVIVVHHPRDLPSSIFVLPEMYESSFPDAHLFMPGMMKTVHAGFERAVSLHVKSLHSSRVVFPQMFFLTASVSALPSLTPP